MFMIEHRHLLTKVEVAFGTPHISDPYKRTEFTFGVEYLYL